MDEELRNILSCEPFSLCWKSIIAREGLDQPYFSKKRLTNTFYRRYVLHFLRQGILDQDFGCQAVSQCHKPLEQNVCDILKHIEPSFVRNILLTEIERPAYLWSQVQYSTSFIVTCIVFYGFEREDDISRVDEILQPLVEKRPQALIELWKLDHISLDKLMYLVRRYSEIVEDPNDFTKEWIMENVQSNYNLKRKFEVSTTEYFPRKK